MTRYMPSATFAGEALLVGVEDGAQAFLPPEPVYRVAEVDPLLAGAARQAVENLRLVSRCENFRLSLIREESRAARLRNVVASLRAVFEERSAPWARNPDLEGDGAPGRVTLTADFAVADLRAAMEVLRG